MAFKPNPHLSSTKITCQDCGHSWVHIPKSDTDYFGGIKSCPKCGSKNTNKQKADFLDVAIGSVLDKLGLNK